MLLFAAFLLPHYVIGWDRGSPEEGRPSSGHQRKQKGKKALAEPLLGAKAHLHICFGVSLRPHKEPQRGGVIFLYRWRY